jgi:hypothetical protein
MYLFGSARSVDLMDQFMVTEKTRHSCAYIKIATAVNVSRSKVIDNRQLLANMSEPLRREYLNETQRDFYCRSRTTHTVSRKITLLTAVQALLFLSVWFAYGLIQ